MYVLLVLKFKYLKLAKNIFLLLAFLTFNVKLNAQDLLIDSLKQALKTAKHDTTRCNILNELIESENEDKVWSVYNDQLLKLAERGATKESHNALEKKCYLKYLSAALNNIGFLAQNQGEILKALKYYLKSLKIDENLNDKKGIAHSLNNIGSIYKDQGDITKGLEYYHKSLKIREEIKDKKGIAIALNNIGIIYKNQGDAQKGLEYYHKSLKIQKEIKDKHGIASSLNNIGFIYDNYGDPLCRTTKELCFMESQDKALEYYQMSLKIREEIKDQSGVAQSFNNIGSIYLHLSEEKNKQSGVQQSQQIKKALEYFQKSLKIQEEIKDKSGIASSLSNIANVLLKEDKVNEALALANRSLQISEELGYPKNIMSVAFLLKRIYQKQNKHKEAFNMYELYIQMRDSINNQQTKKASIKKQFQYQYEKQAAADSVKNSEGQKVKNALLKAQDAQIKQEKTKSYALYGGLALVLVFAGFMVNRFRVTNKQKQIIELKEIETQKQNVTITQQKHLVEEKHKEITDSINYAERIQRSFLATSELLNENLNNKSVAGSLKVTDNYFVFFQPKDIVSGDFYWASLLSNGNFALATSDSTGHGVPGAIMSILNISCLEKAVEQEKLTEPADILNHTRTKIIERLKKDGSVDGGKDGMDCSLICFDFENNKLTYAAANNPIWIVRKQFAHTSVNSSVVENIQHELIELPSDKMPVGKHEKDHISFKQHTVHLQKGDVVYAFTDGLPDQFGGPKGKKFMYKKLKELLISIAHMSMPEQKTIIKSSLNNWKGNLEQVDDICVIGIKI